MSVWHCSSVGGFSFATLRYFLMINCKGCPNQSKEYWDKFKKAVAQAETEKDKWKPGDLTSELRS